MLNTQEKTNFYKQAGKTIEQLTPFGFPEAVTRAFLKTADAADSMVSTRVPGEATTQLIQERYDLKGYRIKAKSCNWGPMSGFLCKLPPFNKKGELNMAGNLKANKNYCEYLKTDYIKKYEDAFVPLKISETRKQDFLSATKNPPKVKTNGNRIYGIAQNHPTSPTVVMEFLLIKEGQGKKSLWNVYYGNVYTHPALKTGPNTGLQDPQGRFSLYEFPALLNNYSPPKTGPAGSEFTAAEVADLKTLLGQINGLPQRNNSTTTHYLEGIQNPYPPYSTNETKYLNAVTGDYDLFAVWPKIPLLGFDLLPRLTEIDKSSVSMMTDADIAWKQYLEKEEALMPDLTEQTKSVKLFVPVAGKNLSLELTKSRFVYLEIIPTYHEIGKSESPDFGNINEGVFQAGATLSNFVNLQYGGQKETPNAAFHSDEGGRPGLEEIEYPSAVFLPADLARKVAEQPEGKLPENKRIILLQSHNDFLDLINLLLGECYITLNSAWVFTLFKDYDQPLVKAGDDRWKTAFRRLITGSAGTTGPTMDAFNNLKTQCITYYQQLIADNKTPANPPTTPAMAMKEHLATFTMEVSS